MAGRFRVPGFRAGGEILRSAQDDDRGHGGCRGQPLPPHLNPLPQGERRGNRRPWGLPLYLGNSRESARREMAAGDGSPPHLNPLPRGERRGKPAPLGLALVSGEQSRVGQARDGGGRRLSPSPQSSPARGEEGEPRPVVLLLCTAKRRRRRLGGQGARRAPLRTGSAASGSDEVTPRGVQRGRAPLPGARGCPPFHALSRPSCQEGGRGDGRNGRGAPALWQRGARV